MSDLTPRLSPESQTELAQLRLRLRRKALPSGLITRPRGTADLRGIDEDEAGTFIGNMTEDERTKQNERNSDFDTLKGLKPYVKDWTEQDDEREELKGLTFEEIADRRGDPYIDPTGRGADVMNAEKFISVFDVGSFVMLKHRPSGTIGIAVNHQPNGIVELDVNKDPHEPSVANERYPLSECKFVALTSIVADGTLCDHTQEAKKYFRNKGVWS